MCISISAVARPSGGPSQQLAFQIIESRPEEYMLSKAFSVTPAFNNLATYKEVLGWLWNV